MTREGSRVFQADSVRGRHEAPAGKSPDEGASDRPPVLGTPVPPTHITAGNSTPASEPPLSKALLAPCPLSSGPWSGVGWELGGSGSCQGQAGLPPRAPQQPSARGPHPAGLPRSPSVWHWVTSGGARSEEGVVGGWGGGPTRSHMVTRTPHCPASSAAGNNFRKPGRRGLLWG